MKELKELVDIEEKIFTKIEQEKNLVFLTNSFILQIKNAFIVKNLDETYKIVVMFNKLFLNKPFRGNDYSYLMTLDEVQVLLEDFCINEELKEVMVSKEDIQEMLKKDYEDRTRRLRLICAPELK